MCAAYTLRPTRAQILESFEISLPEDFNFDRRILPQTESLVVVLDEGLKLRPMKFSMTPSWSKDPKVKFATHNARIESIVEKPTWREPFKSHRCLVPITEFIEPIYTGKYAGNMVKFFDGESHLLVAAGIYDIWLNKETGEIKESFAIITSSPPPFIEQMGHDRCPLFLKKISFEPWLDVKATPSDAAINLLNSSRQDYNFEVSIDRPLAKGWEKR